jgi:hypothetical protein
MEEIEKKYDFKFKSDVDNKKIINLFNHGIIEESDNDEYLYYVGIYYGKKIKDHELMKKYYLMAIVKGNIDAMIQLGYYYHFKEKKYGLVDEKYYTVANGGYVGREKYNLGKCRDDKGDYYHMLKYYEMAIDKGDIDGNAMCGLGYYYQFMEKNNNNSLMKKYYLMAIDNGNDNAMFNLGYYYHCTEKNVYLMKKYYLMAINRGNICAMLYLGEYYYIKKNYNLMKKYYTMAFDKNNYTLNFYVNDHGRYYSNRNTMVCIDNDMLIEYKIKIFNVTLYSYDKLILEYDFINKNYKHIKNNKYISIINLVYCN